MSTCKIDIPIFVMTDRPDYYGNTLHRDGAEVIYIKDIQTLFERLKDVPMAGLVLEIQGVMRISRKDRDRLFAYVGTFPVLRVKPDPHYGAVRYLDPLDPFFANLEAAVGKRCRNHPRIPVQLDCSFAGEKDPSFSREYKGMVRDISTGGCFVETHKELPHDGFLYLRMAGLENPRPIFSSVRWTRRTEAGGPTGMGLMFIDLTDEQLTEINALKGLD